MWFYQSLPSTYLFLYHAVLYCFKWIVPECNISLSWQHLYLIVLPKVYVYPYSETVREGQNATFICNVTEGIPKPELRWFYKEKLKRSTETLVLQNVTKQTNEGKYTCIATNREGTSNDTATLIVDGKFSSSKCVEIRCNRRYAVTINQSINP